MMKATIVTPMTIVGIQLGDGDSVDDVRGSGEPAGPEAVSGLDWVGGLALDGASTAGFGIRLNIRHRQGDGG